ncbi:hypothetical protein [Streptomyces formicae]|uniref:Lipoprotein n=1 Tax=Streptomyces formicae TaxID=1616117 RepID=A0A291Q7H3_9ACTN|nr:hypothetical protein [Streptomyces formicae]ATL27552.1 hypothetical protein KY5_2534 [Streptomyces formicae]
MNPFLRHRLALCAAPFAVLAVLALSGCGRTDGLGAGEAAPSVSVQPRPASVWPAWAGKSSEAPGADAAARQPPPQPLRGLPKVGSGGLASMDVRAILRADPRAKPLADREMIDRPGQAGLRPPVFTDLTGDKKPELLVAADTESGRNVLVVYTEHGGKVYPILFTSGRNLSVETIGPDLLVRTPCADGGEQAVRFHWDGMRMSTLSDVKNYKKPMDPKGTPALKETPSPKPSRPPVPSDSPGGH